MTPIWLDFLEQIGIYALAGLMSSESAYLCLDHALIPFRQGTRVLHQILAGLRQAVIGTLGAYYENGHFLRNFNDKPSVARMISWRQGIGRRYHVPILVVGRLAKSGPIRSYLRA